MAVDGIRDGAVVLGRSRFRLKQDHLVRLLGLFLIFLITSGQRIARLTGQVIQAFVSLSVLRTLVLRIQEVRAGIKVEVRLDQVQPDGIKAVSSSLVRIEGRRCGMVNAHARTYAHSASVVLGPGGNAVGFRQVLGNPQGPVLGFLAGRQGRTCSGRVGHSVGSRVSGSDGRIGELGKAERGNSNLAFQFREIHFCTLHLVDSHSVADEVEHILGLLCPDITCQHQ